MQILVKGGKREEIKFNLVASFKLGLLINGVPVLYFPILCILTTI